MLNNDRLPPGQTLTDKWPVLTYGETPRIEPDDWRMRVWGLLDEPEGQRVLTWNDLIGLPKTSIVCDLHCVTRWSRLSARLEGARVRDLLSGLRLSSRASHVMVHSYGGYTTNLPLADLMGDDALLCYGSEGQALPAEHGGPCRLLVPHLYLWKSAKWINGMELMERDRPGFWERAGYHMYGDPWQEQRHGWSW